MQASKLDHSLSWNSHFLWWEIPLFFLFAIFLTVIVQQTSWADDRRSISEDKMLSNIQKIPKWLSEGSVTPEQIPNPHWSIERCTACHSRSPRKGKIYLRFDNLDESCNFCHNALPDHRRMHPVGQIPTPGMVATMSGRFSRKLDPVDNRISCNTCHSISTQCNSRRFYQQGYNSSFIRGAPYASRTGLCYECHREADYKQINAHDQIFENGDLDTNSCLICHKSQPIESDNKETIQAELVVDINLSSICINCHTNPPHPGGNILFGKKQEEAANHLVVPDEYMLGRMLSLMDAHETDLPLEPVTGKIYCGTCHNPHEQNVIQNFIGNKGADSKQRLRTTNLCSYCHDL
jgi:hypothetical protein